MTVLLLAAPSASALIGGGLLDPIFGSPNDEDDARAGFDRAAWPYLNEGNRGVNVRAVQLLLAAHGFSLGVDGIFGAETDARVKDFQAREGLGVDGIVGPNTWRALVIEVDRGDSGDPVRAVQWLLNEKAGARLAVDGVFGSGTERAVKDFEGHAGMATNGIVGEATWRNLVWHYENAATGSTLCKYSSADETWGTAEAVGALEAAAARFTAQGYGKLSLGDVSLEHGGDISGHASHEEGLDADLRPVRADGAQCTSGCRWDASCYSRAGTRALVQALYAKAPGHVKVIWFNDPQLIEEGLTQHLSGHDNHLHVRWCDVVHADSRYDC